MKAVTIENYFPVYFSWPVGAEDDPFMIRVGEAFGEKVWTDGHVMMIGEPPQPVTDERALDFERATRTATRQTLLRLTPVGVCDTGIYTALVFDTGPTIQARYYNLIRERWPDVEWYGDHENESVICKSDGKTVAMVMPIRTQGDVVQWREAICQSAKTVPVTVETPTIQASDTEDQNASPVKVQE
jgi:hypothetical protein